jgi:hypothetical protein
MKLIKIEKKTNGKTEQIKLVLSILCLINGIHLSDTELSVLSYYMVYKISEKTDDLLINSKVVKDISALRNIRTKLKRMGFLKRTKELYKSYELAMSKDFNLEDNQISLAIKIDNT